MSEQNEHLTKQEAEYFFAEFYYGAHHIPDKGRVHEFGYGFMVKHDRGDLASFDYDQLTRLVLMAHDKCYRVSIMAHNFNTVKIAIWKRKREGGMATRHPDITQAIEKFNAAKSQTSQP